MARPLHLVPPFQDADLLEHVLSVGYRHFLFAPRFTQVLADTLQEYAGDEDIFLTLRVSYISYILGELGLMFLE